MVVNIVEDQQVYHLLYLLRVLFGVNIVWFVENKLSELLIELTVMRARGWLQLLSTFLEFT